MSSSKTSIEGIDLCDLRVVHVDRVLRARKEAPDEREVDRMARTFKVLGDATRLQLLTALRAGEMCVCDLSAFLHLSESAVSHQLRRLRDLSLVKARREGRIIYYALDDEHVGHLLDLALKHVHD